MKKQLFLAEISYRDTTITDARKEKTYRVVKAKTGQKAVRKITKYWEDCYGAGDKALRSIVNIECHPVIQ